MWNADLSHEGHGLVQRWAFSDTFKGPEDPYFKKACEHNSLRMKVTISIYVMLIGLINTSDDRR